MSFKTDKPFYVKFSGLEHLPVAAAYIDTNRFKNSLSYVPKPSDVFVASYPKTGTTWMQMILWLIQNDLEQPKYLEQLYNKRFLEYFIGKEGVDKMSKPFQIKTHLPFDLVPYSDEAKYVYISRNPIDVCVSFYRHTVGYSGYDYEGTLDHFFELFINGEVEYGDYFQHLKSWQDQKQKPNILFLTFEEAKANHKDVVQRMLTFLGGEHKKKANDEDYVNKIVHLSSFQEMKKIPELSERRDGSAFINQGKSGEYNSFLKPEQITLIKEKYEKYVTDEKLKQLWDPIIYRN